MEEKAEVQVSSFQKSDEVAGILIWLIILIIVGVLVLSADFS